MGKFSFKYKKGETRQESWRGNHLLNECGYSADTDFMLVVSAVTLAKQLNEEFGASIPITDMAMDLYERVKGRKIYKSTTIPIKMYVKENWNDKYELLIKYRNIDERFCDYSHSTYGSCFKIGEVIDYCNEMMELVNSYNVCEVAFLGLMSDKFLIYYCNSYTIGCEIYQTYNGLVSSNVLKQGAAAFNELMKLNTDANKFDNESHEKWNAISKLIEEM